jgi:hypothetical protein
MAIIGNTALTLADWAKRVDDDGKMATVVDLLSQSNAMMEDMLWVEGNQTSGHKTTIRTGLPQGTWRQLYQGVQPTKSTTAQITEACGNLEGYSELDKDLADLNGNTAEFRLSEEGGFYEGMTQQVQSAFLYANSLNTPAQIMGLAPRYNTIQVANAASANNVIDMGGTGSTNCSMWVVGWGPNSVHGIFPKGKIAGLQMTDLGEDVKVLSDGSMYRVYRSHFKWECGLAVRDWRYVVRMCNIDVTLLTGASAANLINGLVSAFHRFPTAPSSMRITTDPTKPSGVLGATRFAIYCNRQVAAALDRQAMNKTNLLLSIGEFDGKPVTMFRGVPIRVVDRLLTTEARIT